MARAMAVCRPAGVRRPAAELRVSGRPGGRTFPRPPEPAPRGHSTPSGSQGETIGEDVSAARVPLTG